MPVERRLRIAICGDGEPSALDADAEAIGRALAEAGCVLLTGGLTGVMTAASRGAHQAGGIVIGVLPSYDPESANPYVTIPICTGMGEARNVILVTSADAVLAIGGNYGTLSEIALARKRGKPGICYKSWDLAAIAKHADEGLMRAESVEQAVQLVLQATSPPRPPSPA